MKRMRITDLPDNASGHFLSGDVMIIEPGEDHHLIADGRDPCTNVWLEAADHRHPDQEA